MTTQTVPVVEIVKGHQVEPEQVEPQAAKQAPPRKLPRQPYFRFRPALMPGGRKQVAGFESRLVLYFPEDFPIGHGIDVSGWGDEEATALDGQLMVIPAGSEIDLSNAIRSVQPVVTVGDVSTLRIETLEWELDPTPGTGQYAPTGVGRRARLEREMDALRKQLAALERHVREDV